jgi:RNA polymerase sigma-70 factor (ECF subfamily)
LKSNPDLEALSDNTLMIQVRDGDLDKLSLLFERYKKPLYGFFYGMNKDAELSEDLVQNVFYRILRYRNVFRGDGDFRVWMFHIARNVRNDHFRKDKIKLKEPVERWNDKLQASEGPLDEAIRQDNMRMLSAALAILPEEKREVLLLSKFQNRNYRDIGEILGCSEGAVKVKVFRALQELKEVFFRLEKRM